MGAHKNQFGIGERTEMGVREQMGRALVRARGRFSSKSSLKCLYYVLSGRSWKIFLSLKNLAVMFAQAYHRYSQLIGSREQVTVRATEHENIPHKILSLTLH